ncbi:MAG: hypothetical protein AABZ64_11320 [Nitrospinota bacterium]
MNDKDKQIRFQVALENLKDVTRDIMNSNGTDDLADFFRKAYAREFPPDELDRLSRALFEVKKPFWTNRPGIIEIDLDDSDEILVKLFSMMPAKWIGKDSLYFEMLQDEEIFDPHAFQFDYLTRLDELTGLILKTRPSARVQIALGEARESYYRER